MRELGENGSRWDTESSAPARYRHLLRMEKEEVVMRNIQDLLDKIDGTVVQFIREVIEDEAN